MIIFKESWRCGGVNIETKTEMIRPKHTNILCRAANVFYMNRALSNLMKKNVRKYD